MNKLSFLPLLCLVVSVALAQTPVQPGNPSTPPATAAKAAQPAAIADAKAATATAPKESVAPAKTDPKVAAEPKAVATLAAKDAKLTAPMALKDGVISQPDNTSLAEGGKAVFEFTVPKDGDYEIYAVVSAPDDDNNSFFVNVDTEPKEDPLMIWDIELTDGSAFVERVVNWRGEGAAGSDEFDPKSFKLTAGAHKLFLIGREPAKLKSVSIFPAAPKK